MQRCEWLQIRQCSMGTSVFRLRDIPNPRISTNRVFYQYLSLFDFCSGGGGSAMSVIPTLQVGTPTMVVIVLEKEKHQGFLLVADKKQVSRPERDGSVLRSLFLSTREFYYQRKQTDFVNAWSQMPRGCHRALSGDRSPSPPRTDAPPSGTAQPSIKS